MNNWICLKCNSSNAEGQRFCGSCGQQGESAKQPELQPTMMAGYAPQVQPPSQPQSQNQPSYQQQNYQQQNQQQQFHQSQQPHQSQPFPPQSLNAASTPKKSNLKLFLALGGVIGLLFMAVFAIVIWIKVISPYLTEQAYIKKEKENQTRADSTSPDSILPADVRRGSNNIYTRSQTFNKLQLLQASQYLTPELRQGSENVTDAAAAEYVNAANGSLKIVTQIFKFNTPENARAKCLQIGREMEKRKDSSTEVYFSSEGGANKHHPHDCAATANGKNKQGVRVNSLYGFLIVSTGGNYDDVYQASSLAISSLRR